MENLEKFKHSKYIFVVGIGGSDLASKAVWNAMSLHKNTDKKLFFLESPDSREYEEVQFFVENEIVTIHDVALIVISKSGKTTETLEAFHKTFEILSEKFGEPIHERTIIITSPETPLAKIADQKGIEKIEWEGNIGGRFSAFTVAHTTVLEIAGLDAESFVNGSKDIDQEKVKSLAQEIFENYKKGVNILDFFIFNSELEDVGKWGRQLIAESLALITPTVSIGPTDLHSMLELYLGGPKNRFTLFIMAEKEIDESVNENAYKNVTNAFMEAEIPFAKFEMNEISEYEIGRFMAYLIGITLELATLLEIDPYDQPAVENYKANLL